MHETKERFGDFFSMAAHQATQSQNFTPMQLEGDVFIEAFLAQSVYLQNDFTCFGAFIIIRMIELGDVFIAFPGATGTLEEVSEILSKLSLYQLECPCIFYNVNGYYNHLKAFLQHMIDCELSTPKQQQNIYFLDSIDEIANKLKDE